MGVRKESLIHKRSGPLWSVISVGDFFLLTLVICTSSTYLFLFRLPFIYYKNLCLANIRFGRRVMVASVIPILHSANTVLVRKCQLMSKCDKLFFLLFHVHICKFIVDLITSYYNFGNSQT